MSSIGTSQACVPRATCLRGLCSPNVMPESHRSIRLCASRASRRCPVCALSRLILFGKVLASGPGSCDASPARFARVNSKGYADVREGQPRTSYSGNSVRLYTRGRFERADSERARVNRKVAAQMRHRCPIAKDPSQLGLGSDYGLALTAWWGVFRNSLVAQHLESLKNSDTEFNDICPCFAGETAFQRNNRWGVRSCGAGCDLQESAPQIRL